MKPRIVIQFACTAKEKRQIQVAARRRGTSVSAMLRSMALVSARLEQQAEILSRAGIR